MYEIFEKLLEKKGVTAYRVSKETGVGRSTFTDWKLGRSEPKGKKLEKIAEYFGVSVDYLMTGKETIDKFSDENAKLVAKIRNDENLNSIINTYLKLDENKQKTLFDLIMMIDAN